MNCKDCLMNDLKKRGALEELNWVIKNLFEKQQIYPFESEWIENEIRKRIKELEGKE